MTLSNFFTFIRWKNLCILLLCQILFKYFVFPFYNTPSLLSLFDFSLLVLSTITIAAGGNVINDIFDVDCDTINKPNKVFIPHKISPSTAIYIYLFLTVTGVSTGIFLSLSKNKPSYSLIFISIAILLYFYSSFLKKKMFVGNLIIAFLVSSSLVVFALFDTYFFDVSKGMYYLWIFTYFSFTINLLREIIKDIEDIKGDYNAGYKTLPIIIGVKRTIKVILILSLFPLYSSIAFLKNDLKNNLYLQIYFAICILIPLFYFIHKTYNSTIPKHFNQLSKLLKWILIFGLLLIYLMTL